MTPHSEDTAGKSYCEGTMGQCSCTFWSSPGDVIRDSKRQRVLVTVVVDSEWGLQDSQASGQRRAPPGRRDQRGYQGFGCELDLGGK